MWSSIVKTYIGVRLTDFDIAEIVLVGRMASFLLFQFLSISHLHLCIKKITTIVKKKDLFIINEWLYGKGD